MLWKQAVYMIFDELKLLSDDAQFTEDHIVFLLGKYRDFLLKQRYSDIKKQIPESNYQTICLDLIQVPAISGVPCGGGIYLRSKSKVPFLMQIGTPRVFPFDYYQGEITYVSRDRMRYIGHNKFLQNLIYSSLGPDNYLYLKSPNPQYLHLKKIKITGIFQDPVEASGLQCPDENGDTVCDLMDSVFPLEDALVPPLIELIVKELTASIYRPDDEKNNSKDDLAGLITKDKRQ